MRSLISLRQFSYIAGVGFMISAIISVVLALFAFFLFGWLAEGNLAISVFGLLVAFLLTLVWQGDYLGTARLWSSEGGTRPFEMSDFRHPVHLYVVLFLVKMAGGAMGAVFVATIVGAL